MDLNNLCCIITSKFLQRQAIHEKELKKPNGNSSSNVNGLHVTSLSNIMFFIVLGSSFSTEMLHGILITETCLMTSTVEC